MKARQVQDLQEFVQQSMEQKLSYDDYMTLFKSSIPDFFDNLNRIIVKTYGFEYINRYIENGGELPEPGSRPGSKQSNLGSKRGDSAGSRAVSVAGPASTRKKAVKKKEGVRYGDILKPVIDLNGEILGFQLRTDLVKALFIESDEDPKSLERIIRACIYLNRVFRDGREADFSMKSAKPGEVKAKKTFADVELQVDTEDLEENGKVVKASVSESQMSHKSADSMTLVTDLLKKHAIDLETRLNPTMRTMAKMTWKELDLDAMLKQKLSNIFKNREQQRLDRVGTGISYLQYLEVLFDGI